MSNDANDLLICRDCDNPACEVCNSTPRLCGRKKEKKSESSDHDKEKACVVDQSDEIIYNKRK